MTSWEGLNFEQLETIIEPKENLVTFVANQIQSKMSSKKIALALAFNCLLVAASAQKFYFGSDLSYTNEMEDCGAVFKENGQPRDPFELLKSHGTNLARFRLWHTPAWEDSLGGVHRYSDFNDLRRSIARARAAGLEILLDFHLSDFWADPNRQLIPKAWEPVADNLPVLQDSLYQYIKGTLLALNADGLLPEMVQIGNETNRGILLKPSVDAAGWSLDWARNSALFKRAIQAVRDAESSCGKVVKVALHTAGPADTGWLLKGFWDNGVRDFDLIGISYYWAWHKPTTIADAGNVIAQMRQTYGKPVMIFETGYPWTQENHDQYGNIINDLHSNYSPASPANQRKWLTDLTQTVINAGGSGVVYWEPTWVSTPCRTPWGQGSAQEHATFFDFSNNALLAGGLTWPEFPFLNLNAAQDLPTDSPIVQVWPEGNGLRLELAGFQANTNLQARLLDSTGRFLSEKKLDLDERGAGKFSWNLAEKMRSGVGFVAVAGASGRAVVRKVFFR